MKLKFFKTWPWERELILRTQLETLAPMVRELQFPEASANKRAIRCRLPKKLKKALEAASSRLARPMVEILVQAARIYREAHPAQSDWQEPESRDLFEYENQHLVQMVLHLDDSDRRLIQDLGRFTPGVLRRRDAFEALVPIVRQLVKDSGRKKDPTRVSVRLQIPAILDEEISKHTAANVPYLHVLLEACRRSEAARQESS